MKTLVFERLMKKGYLIMEFPPRQRKYKRKDGLCDQNELACATEHSALHNRAPYEDGCSGGDLVHCVDYVPSGQVELQNEIQRPPAYWDDQFNWNVVRVIQY
jgi:hypothetical protein